MARVRGPSFHCEYSGAPLYTCSSDLSRVFLGRTGYRAVVEVPATSSLYGLAQGGGKSLKRFLALPGSHNLIN